MHLKKKHLPILAFWIFMGVSLQGGGAPLEASHAPQSAPIISSDHAKTKSFREWKSAQVQEALSRVTATKTKLAKSKDPNLARRKSPLEASFGVKVEELESQLQQEQAILEMAKDLSVTDYFAGYLTKVQNKKAAFSEVAGKLTAAEVAELMAAYANSVFGSSNSEMPPSALDVSVDQVR